MKISFDRTQLQDLDYSVNREWAETNIFGSLCSSTILGLNTRRKHGLFVFRNTVHEAPQMILSHLQEELVINKDSHPLYIVEYDNHIALDGLNYLEKFELDPYPIFYYKIEDYEIQKSIILSPDANRLLIRYRLIGESKNDVRLIVRPVFGYRSLRERVNPEIFENTEVFLQNNLARFLPFPEAAELFMQFSAGQFFSSPTWYHHFLYRMEKDKPGTIEDLFDPGFLDVNVENNQSFYLSFTMEKIDVQQLDQLFEVEKKKRQEYAKPGTQATSNADDVLNKLGYFEKEVERNRSFFVTDFNDLQYHFSLHCLIALRMMQCNVGKDKAKKIFKDSLAYLNGPGLMEFFMGMHPRLKVEGASSFFFIFLLYQYHLKYDMGDGVLNSLPIMEEIINLVRKNKFPFFRLKRNKLLERQYRKSDLKPKEDYELFFPIYQNFILNVFWYNALCMMIDLGKRKNISYRKYEKWCKKIKQNFSRQYIKSFINNPLDADQKYSFVFHPSLIFSITLPFSILTDREAQILYRILIKQFLVDEGISFPLRDSESEKEIHSLILVGEYLVGFQMLMQDKGFLLEHFQRIAENIDEELNSGIIGFIPNMSEKNSKTASLPRRASGVATAETAYFLNLMEKLKTKPEDSSKS